LKTQIKWVANPLYSLFEKKIMADCTAAPRRVVPWRQIFDQSAPPQLGVM
jgi:hypothetical protein